MKIIQLVKIVFTCLENIYYIKSIYERLEVKIANLFYKDE